MADPQHPAVPFEQAVDLLTGEPRPLQPQHPDIAALVEQRDRAWKALRFIYRNGLQVDPERPKWVTEIISDAFGPERGDAPGRARDAEGDREQDAALRTVARPAEDEEVGPLLTRAKIELAWDDPAVRSAVRIPGKMTPDEKPFPKWLAGKMCDALARLAREKASAERRIDEFDCCMCGSPMSAHDMGSNHAPVSMYDYRLSQADARATRAEQEIARLRGELEKIAAFAPGNGDVCEIIAKIARSALAAAAGAEEPR